MTQSTETKLELIQQNVAYIREEVGDIKRMQETKYVTTDQFRPVMRIAYGMVGIFATIIGALLVWAITTLVGRN
jgi:hypothetical protein